MVTTAPPPPTPPNSLAVDAFLSEFLERFNEPGRHVSFLLGAGTSKAAGLPDTVGLATEVAGVLEGTNAATFTRLLVNRNIEQVLTRVRDIARLLEGEPGSFDSLNATQAHDLDLAICSSIADVVSREPPNGLDIHRSFGIWLGRCQFVLPVEVFTINYDLLLERGMEAAGVPHFDGFVGVFEGLFRPDLVDAAPEGRQQSQRLSLPPGWPRLWKLHGSISWVLHDDGIRREYQREPNGTSARPLAIYPSADKHEESRRAPFVTMFDRFRRSFEIPETVTIVAGYSFNDEHINRLLFQSAERFPRSEVIALFKNEIPPAVLEHARAIANLTAVGSEQAVIGRSAHTWSGPMDAIPSWDATSSKFRLGDFKFLVDALLSVRQRLDGNP